MANSVAWSKTVSLHWQRSAARRAHVVGAYCSHCKRSEFLGEIGDDAVEDCAQPAVWIERVIRDALDRKMPACASGTCDAPNYSRRDALKIAYERIGEIVPSERFHVNIGGEVRAVEPESADPMERMVDGKTVRECLEAYEWNQRNDHPPADGYTGRWIVSGAPIRKRLTDAQKDAARTAWSAALRAKVEEARERERCQVVCDWQDEP